MTGAVRLGHKVPDITLETFEPEGQAFGTFSLAQQAERRRWTLLFFYPADFTFV